MAPGKNATTKSTSPSTSAASAASSRAQAPRALDPTGVTVTEDATAAPVPAAALEPLTASLPAPDPEAWREGYPYEQRLSAQVYAARKRELQVELLRMQQWVRDTGQKVLVLFEGRDAAGKGGALKPFTEHLNPRGTRVVALEAPTGAERTQWYFQRYLQHLPSGGEIVLMDRSWYNRAGVERVMGYCTPQQYLGFMRETPALERMLVNSGIHLVKLWFSVSRAEQRSRFAARELDPVKRLKLSAADLATVDAWDDYTAAKETMFFHTDTADAPWTVVKSNDKRRARLEAMRHVLHTLPYPDKDNRLVHEPDALVCGPAACLSEPGEHDSGVFPSLR
jgi:polyphosphate kinase